MIIELTLVVCLRAEMDRCSVERPYMNQPYENTQSCARDGMFKAVAWEEDNPRWLVRNWRCQPPEA